MNDPHLWWEATATGMNLFVHVVPGAKKSEIAAIAAEYVRIRLHAQAVEGQANAELLRFIAQWCNVRKSAVSLVSGEHARLKKVAVDGLYCPPDTTMF